MFQIRTLARQELGGGYSHGPKITIDTSEIEPGLFETMALRPGGTEIESRQTHDEKQALLDFAEILKNQAGPIQKAFLKADMKQGERYTIFKLDDFGFPTAMKIMFQSMELTTYAQHRDVVKLTYRPARGRRDVYVFITEGSFAICKGWQDLPKDFGYEVTSHENGVTTMKSKYSCFEAGFFEDMKEIMKDVISLHEDYRKGVNGRLYA